MKPIELINEIQPPRKNRGSIVLGLLLLGTGYFATNQAIIGYHKGIKILSMYIIQHDLAETGLDLESRKNDKLIYATALKLDQCLDSLQSVRESIEPFPLGGPQAK